MKDKIYDIINLGNSLLNKGNLLFGLTIKPERFEEYNLKVRELKKLNFESNRVLKGIQEIEIIEYFDLISKEYKNPPGTIDKFAFAYWTGDIFLSKQTSIKSHIRNINMTLDTLLHDI